MKITPGTNKPARAKEFTKDTSEQPKPKANELKIPKSVTDNPQKHRYQRTVRPISNGHIIEHSFNDGDGNYQRHEVYSETDPFEGDSDEKNPFGEVGGIKSK
jgi:hypothetical protein